MLKLRQLCSKLKVSRAFSSEAQPSTLEISPHFVNRNPRNLERMQIGYKPDGYHLEKPGKSYWHKLTLTRSGRYVYAAVEHFENGPVVKASTSEWAVKKQLYKCRDTAAYYNLGRVLADRCLKAGLTEIRSDIEPPNQEGRIAKFLEALQKSGVVLQEPPQFKPWRPFDKHKVEKPWEVVD